MACLLSNLETLCAQYGAVVAVYIGNLSQVYTTTFDGTDEEVTTMTFGGNLIQAVPEGTEGTTAPLDTYDNSDITAAPRFGQTVTLQFLGASNETRLAIKQLTECCERLFAIVEFANGDRRLIGVAPNPNAANGLRASVVPLRVGLPNGVNYGTANGSGVVTEIVLSCTMADQAFYLAAGIVLPVA